MEKLVKGGYVHTCPRCEEEFTGRLNKKYCSERCKAQRNNERARERLYSIHDDIERIKRMHRILSDLMGNRKEIYLAADRMDKLGINQETPYVMTSVKGVGECFRFGQFALRMEKVGDKNKIRILKLVKNGL